MFLKHNIRHSSQILRMGNMYIGYNFFFFPGPPFLSNCASWNLKTMPCFPFLVGFFGGAGQFFDVTGKADSREPGAFTFLAAPAAVFASQSTVHLAYEDSNLKVVKSSGVPKGQSILFL